MPDSSVLKHKSSSDRTTRLQEVTLVNTAEGLSTLQQGSQEVIVLEDLDVPIRSKMRAQTRPESVAEQCRQITRNAKSQKRRNVDPSSPGSELRREPHHESTRNTRSHHRRTDPTDRRSQGGTGTQKARDTVGSDTREERHRRRPRRKQEFTEAATGTKRFGAGTTSKRRTGHFEQGVRPRQKPERSLDITKTSRPTRKVTSTTWRIDFGVEQHIEEYSPGEETELNHPMTEGVSRKVGPKESQSRWLKGRLQFGNTQIDSKHEKPKVDRLTTRPGNRTDTNHKMTSVIDLVRESQNTAEQGIGHYERDQMYSTWRDYEKKLKSYARELEAYETSKRERASSSNWWSKKSKSRSHRPHEPFPPPKELSVESYKDLRDTLYTGYNAGKVDPTSLTLARRSDYQAEWDSWNPREGPWDEEEDWDFPPLSEAFERLMVSRADIKGETLHAPGLPEEGAKREILSEGALKALHRMYKKQSRLAERTETESSVREDEDAPYPPPGSTVMTRYAYADTDSGLGDRLVCRFDIA